MKIQNISSINFGGDSYYLEKYRTATPCKQEYYFNKLWDDEKLAIIHERLLKITNQLTELESKLDNNSKVLSKNQEKIQKFANYAAVCALYQPVNDKHVEEKANNIINTAEKLKVDVIA